MSLNQMGLGLVFTATDLASGVMGKVRNGFAQTRDEMGRFGSRSKEEFERFGKGVGLMTAGLAGMGALGAAVVGASELGAAIARVATIAEGTDVTRESTEKLALSMGKLYGGDLVKQVDAIYSAIGSGAKSTAEAGLVLDASNKLAIGGITTVDVAMNALMGTMNAFSKPLGEAEEVADSFFQAVKLGGSDMTVQTLANAIGRVAPTAAAFGVSIDELTGSLARMTQVGIKTDEAVTGLKATMDQIIKPTADAKAEATRLGIQFDQGAIKAAGGFEKFVKTITANPKFNEKTLVKLFGSSTEALNSMLALTANGGKEYAATLAEMGLKTGAASKATAEMAKTAKHAAGLLKASLQEAVYKVGKALEPAAVAVMGFVNRVVQGFNALPEPIRKFVVMGLAAASTAMAVVGAVTAARSAFMILGSALKFAGAGGAGLLATFGPALIIIGAVAAAAYGLKVAIDKNIGGIGDTFNRIKTTVSTVFEALGQLFTDGGFSGAIRKEFEAGSSPAINFALTVWGVVQRIKNFLSGIGAGFSAAMDAAKPVIDTFKKALSDLGDAFGSFGSDTKANGEAFDSFGAAGAKVGVVLGKIASVVISVMTIATNIVTGFVQVWGMVEPGISAVGEAIGELLAPVGELISDLSGAGKAGAGAGEAFKMVGSIIGAVLGGAFRALAGTIRQVASIVKSFVTIIGGAIDIVVGLLTGDWDRAWRGVKKVVFGVVSAVIDLIFLMVQGIADAVDAVASIAGFDTGLGKKVTSFKDDLKDGLRDAMGLNDKPLSTAVAAAIPATTAPPTAPAPGTAPALASMPEANVSSMDPAVIESTAKSAAVAAVKAAPPTTLNATLEIDGETLGKISSRVDARNGDGRLSSGDL